MLFEQQQQPSQSIDILPGLIIEYRQHVVALLTLQQVARVPGTAFDWLEPVQNQPILIG